MDLIFFRIGHFDVTFAQSLVAAGLLIAAALFSLVIATFRNNGSRLEESARVATEALRVNFVQQIADRDARIRALEDQVHDHQHANTQLQSASAALQATDAASRPATPLKISIGCSGPASR